MKIVQKEVGSKNINFKVKHKALNRITTAFQSALCCHVSYTLIGLYTF